MITTTPSTLKSLIIIRWESEVEEGPKINRINLPRNIMQSFPIECYLIMSSKQGYFICQVKDYSAIYILLFRIRRNLRKTYILF